MIEYIKNIIYTPDYDFLRTNEHLGNNIILLGLGGSHAYGTNIEGSDVDIRGCALNTKDEILLGKDFEQVVNKDTDTTIYSAKKLISMLAEGNPNTIEILGLKPEHYLVVTDAGKLILDNKDIFLSQRVASSFGGYMTQQLYRLQQKSLTAVSDEEYLLHITKVLNAMNEKLDVLSNGKAYCYLKDMKIYIKVNTDAPIEEMTALLSEFNNTIRAYNKETSKRNNYAMTHDKIGKHSMHLLRSLIMGEEILRTGEIHTYREKEHDLLMDIRNKKYMNKDGMPTKEFFDLVTYYDNLFKEAKKSTKLPEKIDREKIDKLIKDVQEIAISGNNKCTIIFDKDNSRNKDVNIDKDLKDAKNIQKMMGKEI